MEYHNPDSASWDPLSLMADPQYYHDFTAYNFQPEHGFVHSSDNPAPYAIQSVCNEFPNGAMYPMDTPSFKYPSCSEAVPTEVFQSVPSTTYSTPASYDHPPFEPAEKVLPSVQCLSHPSYYPPNQVEAAALAPVDPQFPESTQLTSTTYHIHSPLSPVPDTPDTPIGTTAPSPRKRRHVSVSSQSDENLSRVRRTRRLKSREATAKVREIGACLYCRRRRTSCLKGHDAEGPCKPCLEVAQKTTVISGLLRPICWRPPKIETAEIFRRGPTIDFAASLRGHKSDAKPGKQAVWDLFATGAKSKQPPKVVQVSQFWTSDSLTIELHRYQPMETDKQHYTWYDDGIERHYDTPSYGIANWRKVQSSIERFTDRNFHHYIDAHLRNATEITRRTFDVALEHRHLPLVDRALKLWVGCRFIEEPWSITSAETLSLSLDPNPNSPYASRIPVPPIVDLQIDLIVINSILQPLLKETLTMMNELLETSGPWKDWFEIHPAYFVLLHNVELTMKHDAWFVKRHGLKTKYSNKPLIETIMQGATTLLQCFHYAHQGYAPFTNPELEKTEQWTEKQMVYIRAMRVLFKGMSGDCVADPAREGFWTSQLGREDWRPVFVC